MNVAVMTKTMLTCLALVCGLGAQAAHSAENIRIENFDAFVTGKTFDFSVNGFAYGTERYWPNRRVEWRTFEGTCLFGRYFEWQGKICFVYDEWGADAERLPQCWTFMQDGDTITAQFYDPDRPNPIIDMIESATPLECEGPEVGA